MMTILRKTNSSWVRLALLLSGFGRGGFYKMGLAGVVRMGGNRADAIRDGLSPDLQNLVIGCRLRR